MTYCVNPDCSSPHNPETNQVCQGCAFNLWLQNRYRAINLMGQGGFSRTFLAIDENESPCVLKQLWTKNLSPEATKKAIALFQQEVKQLEELGQHPQIPSLLAHFEQEQYLYLVQEFIEGMNLAKVVEEEGTFNEAQIWQLLDELLPVLKFVHDHQVIHRDIKPENIIRRSPTTLLRGESEGGRVTKNQLVLVDFGCAKRVTAINSLKTGTRIGSPEYVAPEQARGKAVFASDLYSLGISCIYLLTGIPPFDLFDVVNDCWVWRDYLIEDVTDSLAQILDKLLQNALSHRFQSVDEVINAICADFSNVATADAHSSPAPRLRLTLPQQRFAISQARNTGRPEKSIRMPSCAPSQPKPLLWQCLHTLTGNSPVNSVAISPDGKLLASGNEDKTIRLWNLETGELISTLTGHSQGVKSVAFSPDGAMLATGSDDNKIKLWCLNDFQEICTFLGHSHAVKSVVFSPDGQLLASGSWDKTIKLWNVQMGVEERTLAGHTLQVTSLAFSPCGKILASASCDRTVRLWNLTSGVSTPLYGHTRAVFAVAFSLDGKVLATGSDDNTLLLWDWNRQEVSHTLSGHSWSVVAVTFSPNEEILISGSWDKTIKLWQLNTTKEIATLTGHLDSITSVATGYSRKLIASGSKDKTIRLWQQLERRETSGST